MNIASPQHAAHAAGLIEALALKATVATPPAERPPRTPELQRIIELEDQLIAASDELATLRNMVYTREGVMAMLKRHWKDIYRKVVQQ